MAAAFGTASDQISEDAYDPIRLEDDEKQRVLAAIDRKIAGQDIVPSTQAKDGSPVARSLP